MESHAIALAKVEYSSDDFESSTIRSINQLLLDE